MRLLILLLMALCTLPLPAHAGQWEMLQSLNQGTRVELRYLPSNDNSGADMQSTRTTIRVHPGILDAGMSDDEIIALYYHELGHIRLRHFDVELKNGRSMEQECAANQWSFGQLARLDNDLSPGAIYTAARTAQNAKWTPAMGSKASTFRGDTGVIALERDMYSWIVPWLAARGVTVDTRRLTITANGHMLSSPDSRSLWHWAGWIAKSLERGDRSISHWGYTLDMQTMTFGRDA